jgi:PAS domain S-box-containing protein
LRRVAQVPATDGIDMTERGQHPREEEASLDESRLESLWRISTHSTQSIPELLDFALSEAIALTGSRIGYIYFYDEETRQFRLNTWSKEVMSQCTVVDQQTIYQLEKTGIWGEAVRQRRPILVNDFAAPNPLKRGLPEGHAPLTRFLTIPVSSAGKIAAVIGVANKTLPYDHKDIRQLSLLMESVWQVVERRRAEEELRQNEEKFRALFDTLIQGVVFQDKDGRIISANVAAERILGVPFEEMRGLTSSAPRWRTVREDGSALPGEEHPIPVALRTGREVKDVVHGVYNPQRQCTVWIRVTAVPLFREGEGRPYQAYATLEDISERRATEATLRENEEKYRAIFTQSTQGIYLHDLDGRILDVNEVACVQSGYTREELLERTVFDNFPKTPGVNPMSTETILALWRAWPPGQRHLVEGAHLRKDGTLYPVEISTGSVSYGGRKLMLAVVQDITERKRIESALRDQKERLAVTLRSIADGVITTDIVGRVVMMNPVAEALTGWTSSEAVGRPLVEVFNLVSAKTGLPCGNPVTRVLASGQSLELPEETHLLGRHGAGRPIADSAAPIKDADGMVVGVVLVFRDVTEKQRLAESLQQTSRLESLGVLAGGIAHDFNNLLGGVFGYVDLARLATREQETAEHLTRALGALGRARDLTGQLLTFAKGGAPMKKIQSLFPFVEEAAQFALSGSATSCRFEIEPGLWSCDIDRNQIGQVIDNIVINAEQAMAGGGVIDVTARNLVFAEREHPQLAAGPYVRLAIADRGVGIPRAYLARVFDPFYTTKPKGHGLGLATSYSIVRRHGGCIDVESEAGQGSVFSVYLPAAPAAAPADGGAPTGEHRGRGTFVVMDDEKVVRESIGKMLESFGYTPVLTENGAEALALFAAEHAAGRTLAGMLFDLTVPGAMGGKEAIAAVRQICSRTPVFVTSGYAEDPVMASPREHGFSASICKPFIRADLARLLAAHLPATG